MCNPACIEFGRRVLDPSEVAGKDVIEVGSLDVNGSLRPDVEALGPRSYVGVDLAEGPGVDEVCPAEQLIERFGSESFDVVVCTEMLEHVREWRVVASNLKRLLRPGGVLLLTTRSRGFPYHEFPFDYWRYEEDDIRRIFGDLTIEAIEPDTFMPGIFVKARRPADFKERPLDDVRLWSIVTLRRCRRVTALDIALFRVRYPFERLAKTLVPQRVKDLVAVRLLGRAPRQPPDQTGSGSRA
ncbi:MAG: methyltransferase domain-containing protein [Deltaproteobacteria bacterium]|nr:MAG: methyltransferase domain-containing protein [Deltaproteobacteria bacterium]